MFENEDGVNVNERNWQGKTCLHIQAGDRMDTKVVKLLLANNADVNLLEGNTNRTALIKAAISMNNISQREIIEMLLKAGARKDIRDRWGKNATDIIREWEQKVKEEKIVNKLRNLAYYNALEALVEGDYISVLYLTDP